MAFHLQLPPGYEAPGRGEARSLACAFLQRLRREEWVPVRGDGPPKRPGDVWISDNDGALGFSEGRRLAVPVENQDLVKALGFHTHLTVAELLDVLKERQARDDRNLIGYRELYSLLDHACREEGNWELLRREFKSDSRLVHLPNRPDFSFAASDEVVWSPSQSRRYKGFPSLETSYPTLKEFFLKLEVAERATPQLALETLSQVSDSFDKHDDEAMRDLERVRIREAYEALAAAGSGLDESDEELEEFRDKGMLLAENGGFYRCSDLIAPDDAALARLFRERGVEPFLWLPEPADDAIDLARSLVRLFGLRSLSSALSVTLRLTRTREAASAKGFATSSTPRVGLSSDTSARTRRNATKCSRRRPSRSARQGEGPILRLDHCGLPVRRTEV